MQAKGTRMRTIVVGLVAGVAFLALDGVVHANPLAQQLYAVYRPMARPSVNALAGSAIDLGYGVVLAALFVMLRASLPGKAPLTKGLSFGLMVWFLRVLMSVAGEWVTTTVPASAHLYTLMAGLAQVLLVAVVIALLLPQRDAGARG